MSDIKPCPFCMSEARADIRYGAALVECTGCEIFMMDIQNPYCDEVVERWNNRVTMDTEKQND